MGGEVTEPTELGAQVRDRDGDVWTLVDRNGRRGWLLIEDDGTPVSWTGIQMWGPMEETS